MALIACKECTSQVSDQAFKCPSCGTTIRKPTRGFFGKIFKYLFIIFNILMLIWLINYWMDISSMSKGLQHDAEKVGAAIGGTIGTGLLFGIWVIGDFILGLFVLLTRPKS